MVFQYYVCVRRIESLLVLKKQRLLYIKINGYNIYIYKTLMTIVQTDR